MSNKNCSGEHTPRLKQIYHKEIIPAIMKKFGYSSIMQAPKITKITLNMGLGAAVADKKIIEHAINDLTKIAGQRPVVTRAKKSIAGFKIRDGYPIGCMVTLRGNIMYEFLDRLISIALPRVRDFRGISSKAFDKQGNYNLGLKEQIIFPEIEYDKIDVIRGLDIAVTIDSNSIEASHELLKAFNFPLK